MSLAGTHLKNRTFLLGNEGSFVLYLPVEQNVRDRTLMPIKWFGASEFGRKYLEETLVWVIVGGAPIKLDRTTQTEFVQHLDRAVRTFRVDDLTFRQTFLVLNRIRAFVMTLEADRPVRFALEPEFDMRYYQAFNQDFSGYRAAFRQENGADCLFVSNRIKGPATVDYLEFYSLVTAGKGARIELLPAASRLREKTYLKDEAREMLIHSAYAETHEIAPDEAPIWDTYQTQVYAPARLEGEGPLSVIYAFGGTERDAAAALQAIVPDRLLALQAGKDAEIVRRLTEGELRTGQRDVDTAYAQIVTRFNEGLVARDITVHAGDREIEHLSAIFAGNRYFLDAWKRDENISLIGLLATNQYPIVRAILDETWQYQDARTGRLPQIIRLGEALVYGSSDGTLWALRRLYQYMRMSGDRSLLDAKYAMVDTPWSSTSSLPAWTS